MTSRAKAGSPGFSLLEMIIALFILTLLLGMAVLSTRNVLADEEIRAAVRELQLFAKTARNHAAEINRSQELVLDADSWTLQSTSLIKSAKESSPGEIKEEYTSYKLPSGIRWKVKPWGSDQWETPKNLAWIFSSTGLCAPHRFRFERNNSWMEFSINPLTANPQQEDFNLP